MDVRFFFLFDTEYGYGGKNMKTKKWLVLIVILNTMLVGYIFMPKSKSDQKLLDSAMMVDPVSNRCVPAVKLTPAQVTEKSLNKLGLSLSNSFTVGVKK
jgi:hypothetical protein